VPLLPAVAGGVLYNVIQPFFCYLALPKEKKEGKGFILKKYIWAMIPAASIDMFWFSTLAYYVAMSQTQEQYRILVVIAFRLFSVFYTGICIRLLHMAVERCGSDDCHLTLGASMKFSLDAAYEIHVFFTMHDIESWVTLALCMLFDVACLTFELLHNAESSLDALLLIPSQVTRLLRSKPKARAAAAASKENAGKEAKLHEDTTGKIVRTVPVEMKDDRDGGEDGDAGRRLEPKNASKGSRREMAMSLASLEGKSVKPSRAMHYVMAIHARLYATVIVSILLPTWFYGPNKDWYFDFSEHVMIGSMEKMYVATAAAVVHYIVSAIALKKFADVDVGLVWRELLHEASVPMYVGYALAPVFPMSQIGREWSTIYFFRTLMEKGTSAAHH